MKSLMRIPTAKSKKFKNEKLTSFLKPNFAKEEEKCVEKMSNHFYLFPLYRQPVLK